MFYSMDGNFPSMFFIYTVGFRNFVYNYILMCAFYGEQEKI